MAPGSVGDDRVTRHLRRAIEGARTHRDARERTARTLAVSDRDRTVEQRVLADVWDAAAEDYAHRLRRLEGPDIA